MSDVRVDFEEWLRQGCALARDCARCGGRVHPLVDLGGDDHLVMVETPLTVTTTGGWSAAKTITFTATKYVGVRRCSEMTWPDRDDDEGQDGCTSSTSSARAPDV